MKGNLSRFRGKLLLARLIKAFLSGVSVGMIVVGVYLALLKWEKIAWRLPVTAMLVAGCALVTMAVVFLALGLSDKRLARALDTKFSLDERVQTMVAFRDGEGEMLTLQREETERALEERRKKLFGFRRLWLYLLIFCLSGAVLTGGILVKDRRGYEPPVEITPFTLSEIQRAGLEELIRTVEDSDMQEPYRSDLTEELSSLLVQLEAATTEPQMQTALATSLTAITDLTYDASSMTEILNAMWETSDDTVRLLAKALNTSKWTDPDWGDFTEKYAAFCEKLSAVEESGENTAAKTALRTSTEEYTEDSGVNLAWKLESFSIKIDRALLASGMSSEDPLYAVLNRLLYEEAGENGGFSGIAVLSEPSKIEEASIASQLSLTLNGMTQPIYDVISAQKTNTNVGEYVLQRLSLLFAVPIPAFERPTLSESSSGGLPEDDREDEDGPSGGGVGEGVTFGSDDLVLDPLTGEYVEYGTLYARYNTLMLEKLKDERYGYTDAQKQAIEKYFALLYGGLKEEGN